MVTDGIREKLNTSCKATAILQIQDLAWVPSLRSALCINIFCLLSLGHCCPHFLLPITDPMARKLFYTCYHGASDTPNKKYLANNHSQKKSAQIRAERHTRDARFLSFMKERERGEGQVPTAHLSSSSPDLPTESKHQSPRQAAGGWG